MITPATEDVLTINHAVDLATALSEYKPCRVLADVVVEAGPPHIDQA